MMKIWQNNVAFHGLKSREENDENMAKENTDKERALKKGKEINRGKNVKIWVHDGIPFFTLIYYYLT